MENHVEVTLNNPKKLNALTLDMGEIITNELLSIAKYPVMILQGNGRAFCAGGDVKNLVNIRNERGAPAAFEFGAKFFRTEYTLAYKLATSPTF